LPVKSCIINEQNEVVERSTDSATHQGLEDFLSFLDQLDESEDALDE
jgi:hypothetical protein